MNTPDSPESHQARLSPDLLLKLKTQTSNVLGPVAALLQSNAIEDETDKKMVKEAAAFIENPTEEISEIMAHTTKIGVVMSGFEMQGADTPSEMDAMHHYLFILQCINRINFVEEKLEQGSSVSPEIQHAMAQTLDWATILSRGYKDDTCLRAVTELQNRLG